MIKNVAVVFQNNIQFESFINAVDIMIEKKINVDIFVPTTDSNDGIDDMYNDFYKKISALNYNIYRKKLKKNYDILFEPYYIEQFSQLARKYTVKYMYGLTTKPKYSLSLSTNYIFDAFLCYGDEDANCLENYGKVYKIGNIKYAKSINVSTNIKDKIKILYLPTYGDYSSIEIITSKLKKIENKFDIAIKPHHGTEFIKNTIETKRRKYISQNFKTIYSSNDSLDDLIYKYDLIISDMSGAVFDAICLKKPVIMFYKNNNNIKYGNYLSLPLQYAQKDYIISTTGEDEIESLIDEALTNEYIKKQNKAFKLLFCCENNESDKRFNDFLDQIEKDMNESYYQIHQQIKLEIINLTKTIPKTYDLKINKLEKQMCELNNEYQNFQKEIFESKSWKITKILRLLRSKLKK